ncbi:hypothetical protein [Actinophytocola sp.]|uniref:hypothetical protein n=1 Tax=Actinophytocola sp. TaxID=1872138 RepID=UPI003899E519
MTATAEAGSAVRELGRGLWLRLRGPDRSTTRRLLLGLLAGLLVLSALVFATGLLAFTRVHDTAAAVRDRSVPVVGELAVARSALLRADHAAITSFTTGGAQLSGPGDEFQNQLAVASQTLTRVAEHNVAGDAGSSTLQLVEGLLVSYTGMIGQADAHFRQPGGAVIGAVDLWNASRLLHKPDGALVTQLDTLMATERTALDRQLATAKTTPGAAVVVFLPVVALLALLVVANAVFFRRFRRRVNLWLVLAGAALIALAVISWRVAGTHGDLVTVRGELYNLVDAQRARDAATDASGQRALRDLVVGTACGDPGGCGDTLSRYVGEVNALRDPGLSINDGALAAEARDVTEQAAAASADTALLPLMYVLAALLTGAVALGFRTPLNEYRFRPR